MQAGPKAEAFAAYQNPVYRHNFPDPFVLRHKGVFYAYATGSNAEGIFKVLVSDDLVNWQEAGHAMDLPSSPAMHYWAPEVTYSDAKFYLYYSVGNEILMELRVAISDRPDGGFEDAGVKLTNEDFAIDAHVFVDRDGSKWMFYATDFLDHTHIGTGTVMDRMLSWTELEGKPRPVTRAKHDWQVYDPARKEKGGVRWHTVEGAAVIERKGVYYEMFSGGNWQNPSYGVSYAVTDDLDSTGEWEQHADGHNVLPIIRTSSEVVGPGHNSIVRGPNGRELYCVYHRWTDASRVMAVDRMDVVGRRLYVLGPTTTPQPLPFRPKDVEKELPASCLIEFAAETDGVVHLLAQDGTEMMTLDTTAGREYRIEIDGRWCSIRVDDREHISAAYLGSRPVRLEASGENTYARMTAGFEDLFDRGEIASSDWKIIPGTACELREQQLVITPNEDAGGIGREQLFDEIEVVVNARCECVSDATGFGIVLYDAGGEQALSIFISQESVEIEGTEAASFALPTGWDISTDHAYRVMTSSDRAYVWCEGELLGDIGIASGPYRAAVLCTDTTLALDMVRVTGI